MVPLYFLKVVLNKNSELMLLRMKYSDLCQIWCRSETKSTSTPLTWSVRYRIAC